MRELFDCAGWCGLSVLALMNFTIGCFGINYISETAHPYVYNLFTIWFLVWFVLLILFLFAMVVQWIVELVDGFYERKNKK